MILLYHISQYMRHNVVAYAHFTRIPAVYMIIINCTKISMIQCPTLISNEYFCREVIIKPETNISAYVTRSTHIYYIIIITFLYCDLVETSTRPLLFVHFESIHSMIKYLD